jgi:ABC-type phosphate transport system substrate-binding protein
MHRHGLRSLIVGILWLLPLPGVAGTEHAVLAVITNKSVSIAKVTRDDLRPLFQTKKASLQDVGNARPFNLPDASAQRQLFDQAVLGLDADRVVRYWIDRKIRGGERPPQTVPTAALMIKVVSKTPGAVGYVDASVVDASVKVVAKIVDGQVVAP